MLDDGELQYFGVGSSTNALTALPVGPGVVDRFDNVARSQGDVARDILDLDSLRGESTDAIKVFRAFQVEAFIFTQINPGENTSPDLGPIIAN